MEALKLVLFVPICILIPITVVGLVMYVAWMVFFNAVFLKE